MTERRPPRDDAGVTLLEVMVAMTIMSVFMALFTASTVLMYRSANDTESAAEAQSEVNRAFVRLDKEIRYAVAINPGYRRVSDSAWYVEYATTNSGVTTCTQLRLINDQLQRRTWTEDSSGVSSAPVVSSPLASRVRAASGTEPPFERTAPAGAAQTLRLYVAAHTGSGAHAKVKETRVTFSALNSAQTSPDLRVCLDGKDRPWPVS
ncbi:MAG TPA: prepilin-type N-terminal cleavage/methylation domain-containing protein [Pilimelia sp.]|nr:prepilin-type N-terminal cleavage/methylation domain-containing protein [Pilimelia sp.]